MGHTLVIYVMALLLHCILYNVEGFLGLNKLKGMFSKQAGNPPPLPPGAFQDRTTFGNQPPQAFQYGNPAGFQPQRPQPPQRGYAPGNRRNSMQQQPISGSMVGKGHPRSPESHQSAYPYGPPAGQHQFPESHQSSYAAGQNQFARQPNPYRAERGMHRQDTRRQGFMENGRRIDQPPSRMTGMRGNANDHRNQFELPPVMGQVPQPDNYNPPLAGRDQSLPLPYQERGRGMGGRFRRDDRFSGSSLPQQPLRQSGISGVPLGAHQRPVRDERYPITSTLPVAASADVQARVTTGVVAQQS